MIFLLVQQENQDLGTKIFTQVKKSMNKLFPHNYYTCPLNKNQI